jgi:hypothetical protein
LLFFLPFILFSYFFACCFYFSFFSSVKKVRIRWSVWHKISQNPGRRYWFHRFRGISFRQCRSIIFAQNTYDATRNNSNISNQSIPIRFKTRPRHTNNIRNMRKRVYMHANTYTISSSFVPPLFLPPWFLCLSRCVPGVCFPSLPPFVLRNRWAYGYCNDDYCNALDGTFPEARVPHPLLRALGFENQMWG